MAAGLGFKDFVTGEVLTAADVDGYLMQGIWVFANATARDAAVTSPQEGNSCYLKDTDQVLTYSGSAWVAVGGGSPLTTKGDLYTYSTTDARIGVGANGTVLTADSTAATGLKWATPAGGPTGYTLLNTGGTALSGSSVVTVSFSAQKKLWIYFINASDTAAGAQISIRFNADFGSNHLYVNSAIIGNSSWSAANVSNQDGSGGSSQADLLYLTNNAASTALGSISMDLADTTGWKTFQFFGAPTGTGTGQWQMSGHGLYKASAAITSISLVGNAFDAGTLFVYGAN